MYRLLALIARQVFGKTAEARRPPCEAGQDGYAADEHFRGISRIRPVAACAAAAAVLGDAAHVRAGGPPRRTLESVLAQGYPPERMQIAVVDDGSRRQDVASLVRSVDRSGRVEIHIDKPHAGIAGNWNRAIELSTGHLVHLLHQDDLVLPRFYSRMEQAFARVPDLGMAFCRARIVDGRDHTMKTTSRLRSWPGVIRNWLPRIAVRQRIQAPAAVVARSTYERVGAIAPTCTRRSTGRCGCESPPTRLSRYDPATLAVYRRHPANETSRLVSAGVIWPDVAHAIRVNAESLPASVQERLSSQSARWYAGSALRESQARLAQGEHDTARAVLSQSRRLFELIADEASDRPWSGGRLRSNAGSRRLAVRHDITPRGETGDARWAVVTLRITTRMA